MAEVSIVNLSSWGFLGTSQVMAGCRRAISNMSNVAIKRHKAKKEVHYKYYNYLEYRRNMKLLKILIKFNRKMK